MSQRRRLVLVGVGLVVFLSILLAAIFGGMAYNRITTASDIRQPVRITTADFDTQRENRSERVTVRFRVDGRGVEVRLPGSRREYGYLPLRVVYDRSEPTRAVLAADYDSGRRTSTYVTAWVCLGILVLDVAALGYGVVLLFRRTARQARAA